MRLRTRIYATSILMASCTVAVGAFGLYSYSRSIRETRTQIEQINGLAVGFRDEIIALSVIMMGDVESGTQALREARVKTTRHRQLLLASEKSAQLATLYEILGQRIDSVAGLFKGVNDFTPYDEVGRIQTQAARVAYYVFQQAAVIDSKLRKLKNEVAAIVETENQRTTKLLIAGMILASALCVLAALLGDRTIAHSLADLMRGVHRIRSGELQEKVAASGVPEFAELATAFNDMIDAVDNRETTMQQALFTAEEAKRLQGEFLANISHELRTPLNAIINVPEVLLRDLPSYLLWSCESCQQVFAPGDDPLDETGDLVENCPECDSPMTLGQKAYFTGDPNMHFRLNRRCLESARHLLTVINDILDFAKLEAGRTEIHPEEVSVKELLEDVVESLGGLAEEKGLTLSVSQEGELRLLADRVKLSQILLNLLGNSVKFTEPGGAITVSAREFEQGDTSHIRFEVQDTGKGIPAEQVEHIFERFRQIDGSHTREHGGTGLGLSITQSLVELHGGRIWAVSQEGVGSTFAFDLPTQGIAPSGSHVPKGSHVPDVSDVAGAESKPTQRRLAPIVFIVEDDVVQLEVAAQVLEQAGFRTERLSVPDQAVEEIKRGMPDAVILDIMMPRVSGVSILRRLKEDPQTRDIPVIIATAYHNNEDITRRLGGIWVPKPWKASTLVGELKSKIRRANSVLNP